MDLLLSTLSILSSIVFKFLRYRTLQIEHLEQGESCDLPSKLSGHNADLGASERGLCFL